MPKNFYTFLIIPKKKSSAKRLTLSNKVLKGIAFCLMALILVSMYTYYDYIRIKRDKIELERLRRQTREQKVQIDELAEKVNNFALRMEELSQLDKNIRTVANVEDKRYKGQILGIGGSTNGETRIRPNAETDERMVIAKVDQNLDQLSKDAVEQKNSFNELFKFLKKQKSILAATPSIWPVQGWVTSEFGFRSSPIDGSREFHKGIDIATRMGVPVAAPADGLVSEISYDRDVGHMVKIDHGYGMKSWYGHLLKTAVQQGNMVKRGDIIGYVGNTGRSTGSHLHYSVILNGIPINPRKYLN
ncbi:MAG: M23 family metallopeptidase [Syntrophales bacterium]|jgi:murein DD-endopeptidase MepM/ murein hydrolase activator NlpD